MKTCKPAIVAASSMTTMIHPLVTEKMRAASPAGPTLQSIKGRQEDFLSALDSAAAAGSPGPKLQSGRVKASTDIHQVSPPGECEGIHPLHSHAVRARFPSRKPGAAVREDQILRQNSAWAQLPFR